MGRSILEPWSLLRVPVLRRKLCFRGLFSSLFTISQDDNLLGDRRISSSTLDSFCVRDGIFGFTTRFVLYGTVPNRCFSCSRLLGVTSHPEESSLFCSPEGYRRLPFLRWLRLRWRPTFPLPHMHDLAHPVDRPAFFSRGSSFSARDFCSSSSDRHNTREFRQHHWNLVNNSLSMWHSPRLPLPFLLRYLGIKPI